MDWPVKIEWKQDCILVDHNRLDSLYRLKVLVNWSSEALVSETLPETLTKEKQEKLIINKSNCEQDNCESVGCGLQATDVQIDNSKHVDNLLEECLRTCITHLI